MINANNNQSRGHVGNESGMTSDQDHRRPGATAMRARAEHRDSEFIIAQSEHGGTAPDYSKVKGPFVSKAPLDEASVNHLHHGEPPILSYARQSTAPMRHQQAIAHSHPAFAPLVPTSRSKATKKHKKSHRHVERTQTPIHSSSHHDRHPVSEYYSEEGHHVPDQDTNWTLVTHTRPYHKEPALSHHHPTHPHSVLDTPEMNLGAPFDDSTGFVPSKPTGRADQRRLKPFHTPAPWAPTAYEYSNRYSEEHHPPSIHSFSASGSHHAHAVPAHRIGKFKHRYHEENDPTDHHNHHRHQCDDEECSDHDESHIHPYGGNSVGHHQKQHPGFVHYSTPHNRTVGSYDAKLATRLPRHTIQMHHQHMQAPDSPELNLGTLFREDTSYDHPAGKTKQHKQPKSRAPAPALISEHHADRIRHYHEPMHSRSTDTKQTLPHRKSYADVVANKRDSGHLHTLHRRGAIRRHPDGFHGYVFEIPKSLERIIKRRSTRHSYPLRRRSVIFSSFRDVDPVSRYHPAGMYLAPTSVQHGLASAYLRRPALVHHPRHHHAASQQQQPYPSIHHTGSVGGKYAYHVGIGGVKDRFAGSVETMHDLFEGLDVLPSHCRPVQGHVSEYTTVCHSGDPHVAQSASVHHIPSNAESMPKMKKTWYGVEVPVKEGSRPGPLSVGFGFKEIRKAAMEGHPLHTQHASGPSTPVPSTVSAPSQYRALKSSKPIQTYSATVASTLGHPNETSHLTFRPSLKQQRKDARRKMKSTLDRDPHQTLRRRLSVLETVRTALSGVRMDLIEDMNLNELFAEPTDWSSSHEGSAPATSTAEAVVLAGLRGIRHLLDAALNVPARVAHALHDDGQQEETEPVAVVHRGQRHHHSHGHSKAVTLKTSQSGSVDLFLYPEEEPNYPRDADSQDSNIHENPACPNTVSKFIIEMPYHPPRPSTPIVPPASGNMRLGLGHHLAHRQHYRVQNHSTTPTRQHAHSDHHTQTIHSPVARSQSSQQHVQQGYHGLSASLFRASSPATHGDRYPEENVGYPRTDAYSLHRNPAHPDNMMDVAELPLALTSMSSRSSPYDRGLYPEENAGYPRTDAFSQHRNPPHPDLHDVVELPFNPSSSPSSAELSTLKRLSKTHSYNRSKAAGLRRPSSPLYLYPEEQSSYPRDESHDVASDEYDPRADDAVHQSRVYAPNPYIPRKQVHEIQLDNKDQHAHHDAHPTLAESTATAVSSSLDGFKAMLQSIHLPDMVVRALLPEAHEHLQTVQHHTQQLQTVQHHTQQLQTVQHHTQQLQTVQHHTQQLQTVQHHTQQLQTVQHHTQQLQTVQHHTQQLQTVQHHTQQLQTVQHHTQQLQQHPQDHRPVLRYKEQGHELEHEHGEGSTTHHISQFAVDQDSFVPSEHHRRHFEHLSTSSYPPFHTSSSSSSSSSAATAALAAMHSSPISVLPPEASSRYARLSCPPTGFGRGADDDLGEDETIVWTKTVKTTRDFYDVEDDNIDTGEFSYQNQHHGQQHTDYQGQYQQQRPRSQRHAQ